MKKLKKENYNRTEKKKNEEEVISSCYTWRFKKRRFKEKATFSTVIKVDCSFIGSIKNQNIIVTVFDVICRRWAIHRKLIVRTAERFPYIVGRWVIRKALDSFVDMFLPYRRKIISLKSSPIDRIYLAQKQVNDSRCCKETMEVGNELNPRVYWIFDKQIGTVSSPKLKSITVNV